MKTPEEIKKGLCHCTAYECKGCPYYDDCYIANAFIELACDALEYIKLLEKEGAK